MKPLDEFDLELLEAGEPLDPERRAAVLADPTLAPARAELAAMRGWWARSRPPFAPPRRSWRAPGLALALAVALAIVLMWVGAPAPAWRAMGQPAPDVWRVRDGQPVEPSSEVRPGDQLAVALVPEQGGYLTVATLQQDGQVSLLLAARQLQEGARFELPGRIALDAYRGREWLVLWTHTEPLPREVLQQEILTLLPDPATQADEALLVMEITRGRPPR